MKILVQPAPSAGMTHLDGYILTAPWNDIPATPDFLLDYGQGWLGSAYHSIFAISGTGRLYFADGKQIAAFTPPSGQVQVLHTHTTWIRRLCMRVTTTSSGTHTERLYFSADDPADAGRTQFFWLDEAGGAHDYWSVATLDLKVPDPCHVGQEVGFFYAGDFTFDRQQTMYLSNGNANPCGIFRVAGAQADSVTGSPQRIFFANTYCMSDLQHDGEGGLLFTDYSTDQTGLPYRLRRLAVSGNTSQVVWNTQGTPFRSFCVCPPDAKVLKPGHLHVPFLDLAHLKRIKAQLDPLPPIETGDPRRVE